MLGHCVNPLQSVAVTKASLNLPFINQLYSLLHFCSDTNDILYFRDKSDSVVDIRKQESLPLNMNMKLDGMMVSLDGPH